MKGLTALNGKRSFSESRANKVKKKIGEIISAMAVQLNAIRTILIVNEQWACDGDDCRRSSERRQVTEDGI